MSDAKNTQSEAERQLLHALTKMADQYLSERHQDKRFLDNMFMSAGEAAFEQLAAYGLIEVEAGRTAVWTKAGEEFLRSKQNA